MDDRRGNEGAEVHPDRLTHLVIGAAIEVHRSLGPGLLESAYESCLCRELQSRGVRIERQVELPIWYRGERIRCGYRLDIVVEDSLIVEVKAVARLTPLHTAQLLTYLRLRGLAVGLLLNFNVVVLRHGIQRVGNSIHASGSFSPRRSSQNLPNLEDGQ